MGIIAFLIIVALEGLLLGALARLALPGRDPMSLGQTMLVGIAGAVIAGLIARLLFNAAAGFLLAFAVTFGLVYLIRRHRGGSLTRPAPRGGTRF
jgi:uncharacterized membrane protein YeaQ/YmgE (transglycosylase-associated protein family)